MRPERNLGDVLKSKKRKALEELTLLEKLRDKTDLEKGDRLALIIAGLTTILPVAIAILLLTYLITRLVFG